MGFKHVADKLCRRSYELRQIWMGVGVVSDGVPKPLYPADNIAAFADAETENEECCRYAFRVKEFRDCFSLRPRPIVVGQREGLRWEQQRKAFDRKHNDRPKMKCRTGVGSVSWQASVRFDPSAVGGSSVAFVAKASRVRTPPANTLPM